MGSNPYSHSNLILSIPHSIPKPITKTQIKLRWTLIWLEVLVGSSSGITSPTIGIFDGVGVGSAVDSDESMNWLIVSPPSITYTTMPLFAPMDAIRPSTSFIPTKLGDKGEEMSYTSTNEVPATRPPK
mmetsp:Transcript_21546/g.31726  ORF Transcript_21546/g.31726 Transcript_21546/m.31726 type:complete len:128 (-) Transcript_21546:8-391(-)